MKNKMSQDGADIDVRGQQFDDGDNPDDDAPGSVAGGVNTANKSGEFWRALQIKQTDLSGDSTVETGASATINEILRVFKALDTWFCFSINRGQWTVDFVEWGIRTGFSDELKEAGGWLVRPAANETGDGKWETVAVMFEAINAELRDGDTQRTMTPRRLGRGFGPRILELVNSQQRFDVYSRNGTPMSNRLGVKPKNFLAVCSIFEYIKPYDKWTDDELESWQTHNRSVTKTSVTDRRKPTDLRPDPEMAQAHRMSGNTDYSLRSSLELNPPGKEKVPAGIFDNQPRFVQQMMRGSRAPGDHTGLGQNR